jgi:hypothetical protein
VLSVRDVKYARRREAAAAEAQAAEDRAAAARVAAAERRRVGRSGDRRAPESAQNDHSHRHFGFRRGAPSTAEQAGSGRPESGQQTDYQPAHLDEHSSSGATSNQER